MTIAQNTFEQLYERLPERDETDLRTMQHNGFLRYGIVAMLLDDTDRMLLLEHTSSDKTEHGMWGALGETCQVYEQNGHWQVEPPSHMLLRGLREETGAILESNQLYLPTSGAYFETNWPVGTQHGNSKSQALSPIVYMTPEAVDHIMDTPLPKDEIITKKLVKLDLVSDYHLRPGMSSWLNEARDALIHASTSAMPLEEAEWEHPKNIRDAIFSEMFGAE